jgi:hypothetical protein
MKSKQAAAIAAKGKHPVESIHIKPLDDGSFTSRTQMRPPARKPGQPWTEPPDIEASHANSGELAAHVKAMADLGGKPKGLPKGSSPSQWTGIANRMLSNGIPQAGPANGIAPGGSANGQ